MSETMTSQHTPFDQPVLAKRLSKALADGHLPSFLDDIIAQDLADRLAAITREFEKIAIIAHQPEKVLQLVRDTTGFKGEAICIPAVSDKGLFADNPNFPETDLDCIILCTGLEWTNDLPGSLVRLRQALKPDGVLLASMLGGDTLTELRAAWLAAETDITGGASPRVAPFCEVRQAGSLLQRAGFSLPVVDTDRLTVRYDNALALMRELRTFGLSNCLMERQRSLTTPSVLAAACHHYDSSFADEDGRISATFQIIYLSGWHPHESQQKPLQPGSAKMRLADALKVHEKKLPRD